MLRFTIRDLLWLMVVVALVVGWWVEHRRLVSKIAALEAKASQDTLQVFFERGKRFQRMYETAKFVPLKDVEVDGIIDSVLHDKSNSIAHDALRVLPFISDRQKAVSFLTKIVNDRFRWNDAGLPLQAIVSLADMGAVEAIPAVEGFLDFLKYDSSLTDEDRQLYMRAVNKKLNQLKSQREEDP